MSACRGRYALPSEWNKQMASRTDENDARADLGRAHLNDDRDAMLIDGEEDVRVLTALIGCLMVAEDSRRQSARLVRAREAKS